MALLAGGFAMLASVTAYDYGKTTLLVVNAGLLTLWYLELAMILGKRFFPDLLMATCLLKSHFYRFCAGDQWWLFYAHVHCGDFPCPRVLSLKM